MNNLFTKAWRDIRSAPGRAGVLGAAVLAGATSLVAMATGSSILEREVPRSFEAALPPHVVAVSSGEISAATRDRVAKLDGVDAASRRGVIRGRAQVPDGTWRPLIGFVVDQFDDLSVSRFTSHEGAWPPPTGTLLLERSARPVVGPVAALPVRAPGVDVEVPVSGEVHDGALAPAWQDLDAPVYLSVETAQQLGLPHELSELRVRVARNASVGDTAQAVRSALEKDGHTVMRLETPTPRHPHQDHVDALLVMLRIFSGLTVLLAAVLAANLSAARVAAHRNQVGILKAIGARRWQVALPYLAFVAVPSALGVGLGVPLGVLLGRGFAAMAASQLNLGSPALWPELAPVGIAALATWVIPLVAGSLPLREALSMTVREAMAPPSPSVSWIRIPLPSMLALATRTLASRPLRLAGTLVTLSLGGAMLMTAINARSSLVQVVEEQMATRQDDIEIRLLRPAPTGALVASTKVEGTADAQPWGLALTSLVRGDGSVTERFGLHAPPESFRPPPVVEGRWFRGPGEVVANKVLAMRHPDIELDAEVLIRSVSGAQTVRVVGIVEEVAEPALYTHASTAATLAGTDGNAAAAARVAVLDGADPGAVGNAIEQSLVEAGLFPMMVMPRTVLAEAMTEHFGILTAVLSLLALGGIVVGSLGLGTNLALTAMEHRREIGIVKAIGGTTRSVFRWVLLEGALVASGAGVLALLLAIPLSKLVVTMLGEHGLHVHVPLAISASGIFAWMGILVVATALATWGPARSAARLPVQGVLRTE